VSRLVELERKRGTPEAYLVNLPFQVAFLAGEGQLAHAFKEAVTHFMSPLQPMPTVNNVDAWSYKNTMLAAGKRAIHPYQSIRGQGGMGILPIRIQVLLYFT